jgi:hypothetical protein
MQSHLKTVQAAIQLHLQQVVIDEASFDQNGNAVDEGMACATCAAEIFAFKDFVAVPCRDEADVLAKINYVINGTVGDRDTVLRCLHNEDYAGLATQDTFTRSLMVGAN